MTSTSLQTCPPAAGAASSWPSPFSLLEDNAGCLSAQEVATKPKFLQPRPASGHEFSVGRSE